VQVQVSCFEQFPDEIEKTLILNFLAQEPDEDMVIEFIERSINSIPCSRTRMTRV